VARIILRTVADRFRNIENFASQREKLISLGTMAAGLAHELNNPASAALRAASYLQRVTDNVQSYLCELGHGLENTHWDTLLTSSVDATDRLDKMEPLDSLARSDREEVLNEWFEQHNIPEVGSFRERLFRQASIRHGWKPFSGFARQKPLCRVRWLEARLNLKLLLKQIEIARAACPNWSKPSNPTRTWINRRCKRSNP